MSETQKTVLDGAVSTDALRALGDRITGDVVVAGDETYDTSRQAWNLAVDQRPVAVVYAESAEDMVATVQFAGEQGLRVAFNGGGHNAGPISWREHALLVKTERMRGIEIDADGRRARIEAGVLAEPLAKAAGEQGLAYLAGTSPDAGVVGYTVGGGLSWMVRKYGLACNSVYAIEIVTADGQLRRADRQNDPDLFWAVRGGGGNFGAITALELALYPITELYAGCLFWPIERARDILNAWREWIPTVPDECESLGRIFKLPDLPEVPDHLRARPFVMIEPAFIGGESDGAALVQPLRDLEPEFDTVAMTKTSDLSLVNMDPPFPVPYYGEGVHLSDFTAETVDAVCDVMLDSPLMHFEVRHLGGAVGNAANDCGALSCVDHPFTTLAFGLALDADMKTTMEHEIERLHTALAPWDSGFRYLNFAESEMDVSTVYPPSCYARLREVKAAYDPGELFHANHRIPPA
jgi:FAD/FMN-containing dehydrogenase